MFAEQLQTKFMDWFRDFANLSSDKAGYFLAATHQHTQFRVAISSHRPIVDICWAADQLAIINDHHFGVNVDDFCLGPPYDLTVSAQSIEVDILRGIYPQGSDSSE
jgi:hypothetical protein